MSPGCDRYHCKVSLHCLIGRRFQVQDEVFRLLLIKLLCVLAGTSFVAEPEEDNPRCFGDGGEVCEESPDTFCAMCVHEFCQEHLRAHPAICAGLDSGNISPVFLLCLRPTQKIVVAHNMHRNCLLLLAVLVAPNVSHHRTRCGGYHACDDD